MLVVTIDLICAFVDMFFREIERKTWDKIRKECLKKMRLNLIVFNFRSKNLIFSDLNVWLNVVNSSDEILIWENKKEFYWFCWFCWFLLIMIIKASNLASSLMFQIFSRLTIHRSNSSELLIMLKVEKCSDCSEKKWIVSKVWDFWFASQFMYIKWEARDWIKCKNWAWSIFNFDFFLMIQNDRNESKLTEHFLHLIELLNYSDS